MPLPVLTLWLSHSFFLVQIHKAAMPMQASHPETQLYQLVETLLAQTSHAMRANVALHIQTLGGFRVWRNGEEVPTTAWGREKAIHLFQFFTTLRRQYVHKEQIMDRLWPDLDIEKGDRDFKVALNSINKALEPEREPRSDPLFVKRYSLAYGIDFENVWLDAEAMELLIGTGRQKS